ncbi:hypothetical protein ACHWQZ_G008682 [Mnemiopsis leidyi]
MIQFFLLAMLLRSGTTKSGNIKMCESRRCKLCSHEMLQTDNVIVNYQTNETVVNQNNYTCSSKNLVYMICCNEKNCQFQYIGKTSQTLRARMNGHRSSLRTKKGCQFVIEHFTKHHRPANMKVVPLNPKASMEMELIKEFGTLFPYGGNDRLEKPYLDAREHFNNGEPVWNLFTHKKSRRGKRGGRNRVASSANSRSTLSAQEIVDKVTLAKYNEKTLFKRDEHIVFKYTNRYFEDLNMAKLCNSPDILNSYPVRSVNFTPAFSYTKPIRNRVLNYIEESRSTDPPPVTCDCSSSEFMDPTLGHVVTGNLAVIKNSKLRNLLNKGLTYRECHQWKKDDVLISLEKDLDTHIAKQSERKKTPAQCFQLWKSDLLTKVRNKLAHIKIRRFKKPVLSDRDTLAELKKLQKTFIIVPTDKASNNVSIVCRKYYHECMIKELSSNVYLPIQQNEETLVKQHQQDLRQLNVEVPADNESLPFIYSTIKQHKNPEDLFRILDWSRRNNMKLHEQKFELMNHLHNSSSSWSELPFYSETLLYKVSSEDVLYPVADVRDLGVMVSSDLSWSRHISSMVSKARSTLSWMFSVFKSRDRIVMKTLYKSLIRSLLEYCCPLWNPSKITEIQLIESVQRTFTSRVGGLQHLNYWERLKELKMTSLQRRRERYYILMMWKILHKVVPNCCDIKFKETTRHGAVAIIPSLSKTSSSSNQTLYDGSFAVQGPKLWNKVPTEVKAAKSFDSFKISLSNFLSLIPDNPPVAGYSCSWSNSLVDFSPSRWSDI